MQEENQARHKEEIILLTFQPQEMLEKIAKLEADIASLTIDKGLLTVINLDLQIEIKKLKKRVVKPLSVMWQDLLLTLFGGHWEESE
jgi:hypothetical protein